MQDNMDVLLYIEAERMVFFLRQNQLVQANAITQKLDTLFRTLLKSGEMIETNRFWPMFKTAIRVHNHILSGHQKEALNDALLIQTLINQTGEKPCQP